MHKIIAFALQAICKIESVTLCVFVWSPQIIYCMLVCVLMCGIGAHCVAEITHNNCCLMSFQHLRNVLLSAMFQFPHYNNSTLLYVWY